MERITAKQRKVKDFILEFQRVNGRKPLWKEMLDGLKMSNGLLRRQMNKLEAAGELRLEYTEPKAKGMGA